MKTWKLNFLIKKLALVFSLVFLSHSLYAHQDNNFSLQKIPPVISQTINLIVSYKTVNFTGKPAKAIAVNNQIPAPTLHFKKGDHITINVFNHLNKGTAVHWHGLLVPWQMDGVEGVTQNAIPPGGVFQYRFTLYQSGTYWYHAHAGFQQQQGFYGAFIVDPSKPPHYHYNKEYVVVLSDWSNTNPNTILANLKSKGDYYSPKFPLQPSLMKFIHDYRKAATPDERRKIVEDYKMMQQMRMSIYDLSDVAYDAFLMNGQSKTHPWKAPVKVGDRVRLRFIGASGSTIFRVKIPGAKMRVVHVQGNDVIPYYVNDFTITPGETIDVLVKLKNNNPYIIYAESADTLGAAIGALITEPNQKINYQQVPPFPEPKPVTREMMANMQMPGMMHDSMPMDMKTHSMMNAGEVTTGTKYQNLTAAVKTNDPNKPVTKIIRMELSGYMDRFIWFINGVPEYKAKPIQIDPNKRYRIIFTNNSMMHHPMHIHGHWFILRNGHGAYDPLLHTIDVPPSATVVADVDADASGQWFFHCHHLFHMMTGMARVFQYSTIIAVAKDSAKPERKISQGFYSNRPVVRMDEQVPIDTSLIHHPMAHPPGLYNSSYFDVAEDVARNAQEITFNSLFGSDYNKLELHSEDSEIHKGRIENADVDILYWHLLSQFWAIKAGPNYLYRPSKTPYWQPSVSIEGLMPYFIATDLRAYYHDGSTKLDVELSRDTQITNNFFIRASVRSIFASRTVMNDEIGSGLNQMRYTIRPYYRLTPGLDIFTEFEHEKDYGALKNIRRNEQQSTHENAFRVGLDLLLSHGAY